MTAAITRPALAIRAPLPPSTNNAYLNIPGRGRILTEKASDYKRTVGWLTREAMRQPGAWPIEPPYDVTLCYYAATLRRPDAGNVEKLAIDAVFEALEANAPTVNDRDITRLHILMLVDQNNPRLDVVLRQVEEG